MPKRSNVKVRLTVVGHVPSCVNAGARMFKARTEPVGRRLAKWAVPLNVLRMVFCANVFFGFSTGVELVGSSCDNNNGCCCSSSPAK